MFKNMIIEKISEIVTPIGRKGVFGSAMQNLTRYEHYSIVIENGKIVALTDQTQIIETYKRKGYPVISGEGMCATPGYIDSHTHLVFGGYRPEEFDMRLKGKSYMEIMQMGGGIANSVQMTRDTSLETLISLGQNRLRKMAALGVTSVEIKSGYGLDLETEMKQLKAIKALKNIAPQTIISTFLGAHAIPKNLDADTYVEILNEEILPKIAENHLADFVDVFCEDHVFNIDQSRSHLSKAASLGFKLKLHADEIVSLGGGELAAELNAISADHLLHVSDKGIEALAEKGVIATLLPATAFTLREDFAPARKLIESGCAVALATDFNPGSCFTYAIPLIIALSTLQMKMTIEEVLTALTLNAAAAIDLAEDYGSIEIGKSGDLILHEFPSYKFIAYHVGVNTVKYVIKDGVLIHTNS